MSYIQEAIGEYTRNVGIDFPETEWILSPYESWEKNPFYKGKPGKHPEDDSPENNSEDNKFSSELTIANTGLDDYIPF